MLEFNPINRISPFDALDHPFLASLHDVNDEPSADFTFSFEYENCDLSRELLQELMWDEIKVCHPNIPESPPSSSFRRRARPPNSPPENDPPVRLIPFDVFKRQGQMPRCPENIDLLVNYEDTARDESLYIFMSHCWLRGWSGAPGWDGRAHPDNSNHDKYELMVAAVEKIMSSLTTMSQCYIWLDFGCIDQDAAACAELSMLDRIVGVCDLILTNVYDTQDWELSNSVYNWFEEYKSPAWNGNDYAYLSRGWCRVEMLYAANIPLEKDKTARTEKFKAGLRSSVRERRRPHLLYGTKEHKLGNVNPIQLPPLQNAWFDNYNPVNGKLTNESDRVKIQRLVDDIAPRMKRLTVGYYGHRDTAGQAHGRGICRYANGDVYKGEFKCGKRHGYGKYKYSNGNFYDGEHKDDKRNGKGIYQYADGGVYEGEHNDDKRQGQGVYRHADGSLYEGEYKDDKRHGQGRQQQADGSLVHEGNWENDNPI